MNDYSQTTIGLTPATPAANPMVGIVVLVVWVLFYCYIAYSLMKIAQKTGTKNAWLAWIPIANLFLMLMIAKKPLWWFILFLIPLVNIVMFIIVWMKVAEAVNKPSWWGILMIVPLVNLIVPGYLAFSESAPSVPGNMPPAAPAM